MKHLIGIVSDAYLADNEFGIDFAMYQKYGFETIDFQGLMTRGLYNLSDEDFKDYFERLYTELNKYNLMINQLHSLWDMEYMNNPENTDVFAYHQKALIAAYILKAKYVVYHTIPVPGHHIWEAVDYNKIVNVNKEFFNRLLPIAKQYNVIIAIENLPFLGLKEFFSPTGTLKLVQELNDPYIAMCLDTGHFNMFKEEKIYEFLLKAGDKLGCLHMHDNDGTKDSHQTPYLGTFDWRMFIKGLKDINYPGVLSLETKIPCKGISEKEYHILNDKLVNSIKELRKELDKS